MQTFPKMIENRVNIVRPMRMRPRALNTFLRMPSAPIESLQYVDRTSLAETSASDDSDESDESDESVPYIQVTTLSGPAVIPPAGDGSAEDGDGIFSILGYMDLDDFD